MPALAFRGMHAVGGAAANDEHGSNIGPLLVSFSRLLLSVKGAAATAVIVFGLLCGLGTQARALEIEFSGRPVKLEILALYDSRHEKLPHLTRIHKFAEMPLNHLGYRLVFQDVNGRLPDPDKLTRYRGILTWFIEPLRRPEAVLGWLEQATNRGLKYVVLGEIAPPDNESQLGVTNRLLARIGLAHANEYIDLTHRARIAEANPEMVGFERPLDKAIPGFPLLIAKGPTTTAHLTIDTPVTGGRRLAAVIATGPGGGFASQNFTIFYEPNTDRTRWTLNPFSFFKHAFGIERFPIPDATTLSGRRIYFSHIDGDGWNNISQIEGHREALRLSSEVIEREAIAAYPDLPVTVGLIAGDVDPALGGNIAGQPIARRIFAMPQVEIASHTHTHPYDWQFFEAYDRGEELAKVEAYQPPDLTVRERLTRATMRLAKRDMLADRYDKYVAGTDDLPRTYLRKPFDLATEIEGALRLSEAYAPAGRKAKTYLWSGDTTPFPAAIEAVRKAGARNLNGGDSRLDRDYPSVAYVPPLSRPAGTERQIYAGNSNENTYTNDWTGPYFGQFMLEHTLQNTDTPRRLKPFNLYYHMYSGERASALAAIRHFLELARTSAVIPIAASHYSAIADDFFRTEVEQVDLFSWAIVSRGTMQTVRFDDAEQLAVDFARSTGVIGATRNGNTLYVALDPAVNRAIVTLRARQDEVATGTSENELATLVHARWQLSNIERQTCGFTLKAQGYGTGDMLWQTQARRAFRVTTWRETKLLSQETLWADATGAFPLRVAQDAIEPLIIRFECHE